MAHRTLVENTGPRDPISFLKGKWSKWGEPCGPWAASSVVAPLTRTLPVCLPCADCCLLLVLPGRQRSSAFFCKISLWGSWQSIGGEGCQSIRKKTSAMSGSCRAAGAPIAFCCMHLRHTVTPGPAVSQIHSLSIWKKHQGHACRGLGALKSAIFRVWRAGGPHQRPVNFIEGLYIGFIWRVYKWFIMG
jgi:hypothetical protein